MDTLSNMLEKYPEIGHALSIADGIKFASQEFFGGDSSNYYACSGDMLGCSIPAYPTCGPIKVAVKNTMVNLVAASLCGQ